MLIIILYYIYHAVGAQAFKTQIVKNNLNPVWNKHYEVRIISFC